jgi:hypothetical protein
VESPRPGRPATDRSSADHAALSFWALPRHSTCCERRKSAINSVPAINCGLRFFGYDVRVN